MTKLVTHQYTVEWTIHTQLFFEEDDEPPTEQCRDALADEAPGSVLQVQDIDVASKTWIGDGWEVMGVVESTYTERTQVDGSDIVETLYEHAPDWLKDPPNHIVNLELVSVSIERAESSKNTSPKSNAEIEDAVTQMLKS